MATAGGLVLALIALAVLSGPVHAPSPTLTPALVSQASSTPAAPTSTPPIPTSTALSAGTAIAPIAVLQPTETFPPEPTPIGGSQRIAFASDRSGSLQVWIMDAGNPENRQQVTEAKGGACQPAWSPDGTQIAFTTPCIGPSVYYPGSKIKIVRLADKSISDLPVKSTGVAGAFDPAWSPDGKTLLYTAIVGQNTEIRAIGLKDLKTRVLANRGTKNAQPAWSRDGKYIAYIYSDDRNWDALWSMGANGDSQELLARSGRFAEPAWAPDGLHILVSKIPGDNIPVLALFDRSDPTQDAVQLLPDTYRMSHASVSPDGRWAVFWTDKISNNPEILMIRMDGKQIHQLTNNNMRDFQPAWSPQ
jgi:Tol biopolymer transport system component